jgi:hypothetical protein
MLIDADLRADLLADLTAIKNRALSIAANYSNPKLRASIIEISGRADVALGRLASATIIEAPAPEPAPEPAPSPSPAPAPTGTVVELTAPVSVAQISAAIDAARGPITVRPAGTGTLSVQGDIYIRRPDVTLERFVFSGEIGFDVGASRSEFIGGGARMFYVRGAADVTISGCTFDGLGKTKMCWMWDSAGTPARRVTIKNCTIRNYYTNVATDHTEGLYVGYSEDVLIEGNIFVRNGTTAHIFLTWFGDQRNPATSYPRRVCIRGNSFGDRMGAWVDIDMRAEIPPSSGIAIDPAQRAAVARPEFVRACS